MTQPVTYEIFPFFYPALRQSGLYPRKNSRADSLTMLFVDQRLAVKTENVAVANADGHPIGWFAIATYTMGNEPALDALIDAEVRGEKMGWGVGFVAENINDKGIGKTLFDMALADFTLKNPKVETVLLDKKFESALPANLRLQAIFADAHGKANFKTEPLHRHAVVAG